MAGLYVTLIVSELSANIPSSLVGAFKTVWFIKNFHNQLFQTFMLITGSIDFVFFVCLFVSLVLHLSVFETLCIKKCCPNTFSYCQVMES